MSKITPVRQLVLLPEEARREFDYFDREVRAHALAGPVGEAAQHLFKAYRDQFPFLVGGSEEDSTYVRPARGFAPLSALSQQLKKILR